jgi:hypothetical protein
MNIPVTTDKISRLIRSIRDQRVILDTDLATIYGVETRALNQAVKRNQDRFPEDFIFQLTPAEADEVRRLASQSAASAPGDLSNSSQIVMSSRKHRGHSYLHFAFTEYGALMAATVLNSPQAVRMSLFIIRAFVKLREDQAANAAILKRLAEIDRTLLQHDTALRDIYRKLLPLLAPPPESKRREIGFHAIGKEESGDGKTKSGRK